jgi:hypothetical protein
VNSVADLTNHATDTVQFPSKCMHNVCTIDHSLCNKTSKQLQTAPLIMIVQDAARSCRAEPIVIPPKQSSL